MDRCSLTRALDLKVGRTAYAVLPKFTERIVSDNANSLSYISDRSGPRFGGRIGAVIAAFYRCVHAGLLAYDTRHAKAKLSNPSAVANDPHGRFLTCTVSPFRMFHGVGAGNDPLFHSAIRILLGSDHTHDGRLSVGDGWNSWVSVSIILQNISQLKALFAKEWESILGNCDEFLYLGGNEQSTHKYVSELLGKETIDTNSYGRSDGMRGNFSTNYQVTGRELMPPDEVRMLENQYAILFIRGERPILDYKYDILSHPNIALSADGEGEKYDHGKIETEGFGIEIVDIADYPDLNLDEIPRLDEYYAGIYAYDEDETEELLNFLKNLLESEEHETKTNEAVDGGTDGGSAH